MLNRFKQLNDLIGHKLYIIDYCLKNMRYFYKFMEIHQYNKRVYEISKVTFNLSKTLLITGIYFFKNHLKIKVLCYM